MTLRARLAALAALAGCLGALDVDLVRNPQAIDPRNSAVEERWRGLFSVQPRWLARDIGFIVAKEPRLATTMFAARLLYDGPPWTRRAGEAVNTREWRRRSREVRAAMLRELRWHEDKDLAAVYATFIAGETEPELVMSALVNIAATAPDAARGFALRIADASREDRLPGAGSAALRQLCTAYLVETGGLDDAASVRALEMALLAGDAPEMIAAMRLLPYGACQPLLLRAAARLVAEHRQRPLEGEGQVAFALVCARLSALPDQQLVQDLARLALQADRPLAGPAAGALADAAAWDPRLGFGDIVARIQSLADPSLRSALAALLLRLKPPAVVEATPADSPWRRLAEHRARLADWEWRGLVR